MALQDPIGEYLKWSMMQWLEALAEQKYLEWFFQNADFGPAHGDVMEIMNNKYEKETGLTIPPAFREDE